MGEPGPHKSGFASPATSANMSCMDENAPANSLVGRCVLVTGAARRLGAAIVRGFHARGANVCIHCHRSVPEAEQLRDEINRLRPHSAISVAADLLDPAAPQAIIAAALVAFGRLDVLVNNASTFYPTPLGDICAQQWDDLIGTNLRAPLFLAQAAAPHLRQTKGLIVNMVDIHAQRPLPQHPVYCAAKAGLAMLTRSLARELGPQVRVNGVAPGPVLWPDAGLDEHLKQEIVAKTLLKRTGSPQDIVSALLYLAQDAPYVTGQILAVDGGRSVGW
jgi:pteridine reductase